MVSYLEPYWFIYLYLHRSAMLY